MGKVPDYAALKEHGSPSQAQSAYIDAILEHGSIRKAAAALGVNNRTIDAAMQAVRAKASRAGYAPGHFEGGVAPGYQMGKVTVQRANGVVERTWERMSPEQDARAETLRAYVEAMTSEARGMAPFVPAPVPELSRYLAAYIFGDPHFGVRALAAETGADFDLAEADRITRAGLDRLVQVTPAAGKALLIFAGDNTHGDNHKNQTPGHGHALDIDGRHYDITRVTARAFIHCVQRLLEKHPEVIVWVMPGNHDVETANMIAFAMSLYFEKEQRVTVDTSPALYKYLRHGKVLIGSHHGHGAKTADLPLIMACDRPEDWGASVHRYVWQFHIHHDTVKEVQTVRVESVRTLAAADAWHRGKGYRAMRDTRSVLYDPEAGEIERYTCSAAMLGEARAA